MSGEAEVTCISGMSARLLAEFVLPIDALPRVVCAWCKKTVKDGALPASHTICANCDDRVRNERIA